jgi:hypothetical protein
VWSVEVRDSSGTAGTAFTRSDDLTAAGVVTNPCEDDVSFITTSGCLITSGSVEGGGMGEAWADICDMAITTWNIPAAGSIGSPARLGTFDSGSYTLSLNFNYGSVIRSTVFTVAE